MSVPVHILLATYDGAEYLPVFLAGMQRQSFTDWRLIVRDDGSTDATRELIQAAAACDSRIQLLAADGRRLGAKQNFAYLTDWAVAEQVRYAAFADQDDVWHPDKLAVQLAALRRLEATHGVDCPLLVHCDMNVIDGAGRRTAESYSGLARVRHPPAGELTAHLWANDVAGCTILANSALLRRAAPVPPSCVMHDWWLALCAAACGRIEYDPTPWVQYRLHGGNTIGGGSPWRHLRALPQTAQRQWQALHQAFAAAVAQLRTLCERLQDIDEPQVRSAVDEIQSHLKLLSEEPRAWRRVRGIMAAPRTRMHWLRELALALKIATCRPIRPTTIASDTTSRRAA